MLMSRPLVILSNAKDLAREWKMRIDSGRHVSSGAQMLHFVQHDNPAGVSHRISVIRRPS